MARKPKVGPTIRVPIKNRYGLDATLSVYDLVGTPDEVIAKMTALKEDYAGKVVELSWEQDKYDDTYSMHLYELRPENAEERAARLNLARVQRERQDEYDRQQYERLKAKFEKA